jgi:hypothetical protein
MIPTTLQEDAERYAEFILEHVPQAKTWKDPVRQAAWYISYGFAAAVCDADTGKIVSLVTARPVERPGIGAIPYYFNENGKCLHVDLLLDISPDKRSLMVVKKFLQWRFPQCTTIACFRHFEEKIHVYRLPDFWKSYDKIRRVERRKKQKERSEMNWSRKQALNEQSK